MEKKSGQFFSFLELSNSDERTLRLLSDFFLYKFQNSPELFYHFIADLESCLHASRHAEKKKKIAEKYLKVLSPLCERFNLYKEKNTLDDLCFRILYFAEYRKISSSLSAYKKESKNLIQKLIERLQMILSRSPFEYEIYGRYKSLYSIFRKMQKKSSGALELKDIFAFRIIVKNNIPEECFKILYVLHDAFDAIPSSFSDYITVPKINGYQSLHTGLKNVLPALHLPIEVQIRTQAMDDFAEKGFAAHWLYGVDKKSKIHPKHMDPSSSLQESVYFFSYTGDLYKLPQGSSVHDFAYSLHSALGSKATGSLVNGVFRSLDYVLRDGDFVQILKAV